MALIPYDNVPKPEGQSEPPLVLAGLPAQEFYCGDERCDCATANLLIANIPLAVDLGTARVDFVDGKQENQARAELAATVRATLEQGGIQTLRAHYAKTREFGRMHHFRYLDWTQLKAGEFVAWQQVFRAEPVPLFTLTLNAAPPAEGTEPAPPPQIHIGLADNYCVEPRCDCKRVVWTVLTAPRPDSSAIQTLGQVSYSFVTKEQAVTQVSPSVNPNQLYLLVHSLLKNKPDLASLYEQRYDLLRHEVTPLLAAQRREKSQVRANPTVGRNDACPCGSGKKYKKCHGAAAEKR